MQKHRLGSTDIEVSAIGLGTVKLGRNQGVKYPTAFTLPTDNEAKQLLNIAKELGVNLLDTAPAYGTSEERLGHLLQNERTEWVISTKVGEEFVNGASQFDFSPSAIQKSIERSLQRLRTDYLDIVLVHSNSDDVRLIEEEQVFDTLATLKQAGKIRAFGMSSKTVAGGKLTVDTADVVMVTYHPTYTDEREVIAHAAQKNKGILIKKAFASGHLSGSASDNLRFIFQETGVTSIIIGTLNPAHLRESVLAATHF